MENTILNELLEGNDLIMIDTCFAMRDEFSQFIDNIEVELMAHNKKIIVKSVVMAELYRHMGSSDDVVRTKATNAVSTICMKRNIFIIHDENISAEAILKAFADVEFIADFTKSRIKYRMALLTNDYKLGKDISDLNNLESCYGKKVAVFSLNRFGCLEERIYENEGHTNEILNDELIAKIKEEPVKVETKTDWTTIVISSIASFAMGVAIDKYGKQLLNTVVKAIA